ncbi:MAG: hypothetical protein JO360_01440 [Acidobacteria bacterium]|nr:hypothetical protein [Acidobacteriota bacterium]
MIDRRRVGIKIIKRAAARDTGAALAENRQAVVKPQRDAVAVVTSWVRELRRKKAEETTGSFERLFGRAA